MELTPNFKSTWSSVKKPVKTFSLLLFVVFPITHVIGLDGLLLDTLLAKNLSSSGVVKPMLSNYPFLGVLLTMAFLTFIMSKALFKFFEAINNPKLRYNDVSGLKYTDIPPIPNKESVLDYKKRVDTAYYKGINRISPSILHRYGVDENGNLH